MASKDPGFIFYPGDYLRDTQCLSEQSQVAYDRIMCEHMRNICITQEQLNFFTKRLTPEQKSELMMVLTASNGGYYIDWVVTSIKKRREYSESRRKNRSGSVSKGENTSQSYVKHMDNEIENVNEIENTGVRVQGERKKMPTLDEFKKFLDPIFMEALEMNHKGKDVQKAIGEAYTHLAADGRLAVINDSDAKKFVNTWLSNTRSNGNNTRKSGQETVNGVTQYAGKGYGKSLGVSRNRTQ